ncbi:MAG TPA: hypothetical protein VGZ47_22235 [Gemmataceae bacterium]|nr:hypothetical protein [Gemmataceae bacterium]
MQVKGRLRRLLKPNEVVLFQKVFFTNYFKSCRSDLPNENLLARSHMAHHKDAALTFNAVEVDQDDLASWSKGVVDGLKGALRELEVVVRVANKHKINRVFGQLCRKLIAMNRLDVLDSGVAACLLDVTQKGLGNIDGINLALVPDLDGKLSGEKPGACADISNHHSGLEFTGGDDFLGLGGDLPALPLELADVLLQVWVLEGFVDAGLDAFFLGRGGNDRQKANAKNGDY